jgi:hypothetical protein
MKNLNLFLVGCLAFLEACSSVNPTETVSVEIDPQRGTPDSVLLADREVIVLETHPDALLSEVFAIDMYLDKLYLFDQRKEKISDFDRAGNFVSTIGHRGRGPGEYRSIIDFCIDRQNNEILIVTDRPNRILYFSPSGEFLGQTPVDDLLYEIVKDGNKLYAHIFDDNHDFAIYEMEGRAVKSAQYPEMPKLKRNYNNGAIMTPFGRTLTASKYGILFTRTFDNTIYKVMNDELIPFRTVDFGKYYHEDANALDNYELIQRIEQDRIVYGITNARMIGQDRIIFNGFPHGIFTVNGNTARQYGSLTNDLSVFSHTDMVPILAPESDLVAFSRPAMNMSSYYDFVKTKDSSAQFTGDRLRLSQLTEDDNPVIFLYKLNDESDNTP